MPRPCKTRVRIRAAKLATLAAPALLLAACYANTYGVDVHNKTRQDLVVEYLNVDPNGITSVYSTGRLAAGGTFTNKVPDSERGFGKRIRFSVPDRSPEDQSARVELKLSDAKTRTYDLSLNNGRLVANELEKGREPTDRPESRE